MNLSPYSFLQANGRVWAFVPDWLRSALMRACEVALPVVLVLSLAFLESGCTPLPKVDVQQPTTARAAPA